MALKAGIVGLPNVGKSTLFNAITKKNIIAANYPFATIEPNVGIVEVPDERLDFLNEMYEPKSLVPTAYEFIDIAGLVAGASHGEGLGNKFLSHIREVDAIVEVVRCFDNAEITHVAGSTDPLRDIDIINIELILSDLEIIESRLGRIEKKAQATKEKDALQEVALLKKLQEALMNNIPVRRVELTKEENLIIKNFNLITAKKVIYAANVDEDTVAVGDNEYTKQVKEYASNEGSAVVVICAKMEEDLSSFDDVERKEYLKEMGVTNSGLDKLIYATDTTFDPGVWNELSGTLLLHECWDCHQTISDRHTSLWQLKYQLPLNKFDKVLLLHQNPAWDVSDYEFIEKSIAGTNLILAKDGMQLSV